MVDYLRVASGVAVELWTAPTVERDGEAVVLTPADCFHADFAPAFVPAGAGRVGMVTADGGKTWAEPPAPPVPARTLRGVLLVKALDKATKVTPRDLAYVAALDAAREDMPSIIRIAKVDGDTPAAWFDRAVAPAP